MVGNKGQGDDKNVKYVMKETMLYNVSLTCLLRL